MLDIAIGLMGLYFTIRATLFLVVLVWCGLSMLTHWLVGVETEGQRLDRMQRASGAWWTSLQDQQAEPEYERPLIWEPLPGRWWAPSGRMGRYDPEPL